MRNLNDGQFDKLTTRYKVRVGDDGRWHYIGDDWTQATRTAHETFARAGRAEIHAYHVNSKGDETKVGKRQLLQHPDALHRSRGTPLIHQDGKMF